MSVFSKMLGNCYDSIKSSVVVERGVVTKQWSSINNGNGGFVNEPQDLIGAAVDELPDGYCKNQDFDCGYTGY